MLQWSEHVSVLFYFLKELFYCFAHTLTFLAHFSDSFKLAWEFFQFSWFKIVQKINAHINIFDKLFNIVYLR